MTDRERGRAHRHSCYVHISVAASARVKRRVSRRQPPRQARSRATLEAIHVAAARVLARDGYAATSVRRIADTAGVSVGSVYQYHRTKDEIVEAGAPRYAAAMVPFRGPRLLALAALPLDDAARQVARLACEAHRLDGALGRALMRELHRTGVLPSLHRFERRAIRGLQLYLESRRGEIRPADAALAARIVVRSLDGPILDALLLEPELLARPAFIDELAALIRGYLRP